MYGRTARGPLSVLKSSWCGDIAIPLNIGKSVVDYLQEQKINLEMAAEQASLIASGRQEAYARYFNRKARSKSFEMGEKVYLLIPDSTNKLYAQLTGPGEIVGLNLPHSYKVKLSDGKIRHCHVNKIRRYYPRVNAIGVIFEDDEDFGEVLPTPTSLRPGMKELLEHIDVSHLEDEEETKLLELLSEHQKLFTGNVNIAKVDAHKINLKPNVERKNPFMYRIPEALKGKVDQQIQELLELGLIEESNAEIAYPVVCVNKKDGSMRLCIDYRALNCATVTDDFPMEDATELIQSIGRANVITTLDLLKGYWAIPMSEESKDFTSFKTHRQMYRFKVMSFGLKNASATFQRVMNKALAAYREFARAYIDDIAIFSKNFSEHLKHLNIILSKLEELNFTVNLKKCDFVKPHVKFLGHVVGSGRHQPDPEKVRAIRNLASPTNKKELRSVLGFCNYYREYIPKYSELVYPLTELTKKRVSDKIPWTDKHEEVFKKLKGTLADAPSLYTPVMNRPYIIHSDASSVGIAACLSQKLDEKTYSISYASQKLTKAQQAWPTIEREAFAIVWSLKKFESWVFGTEIEFYTDHNPLPFLTKSAPQSSRLQRWAFSLQRFNLTLKHCAGAKMPHADALSRLV
ncbi:retrovirus-related Pol polyprotein from transposon 297 [Nephila pilipes]|uniref:RNA-directed DNA polymerase n=1 Tax=Nephila pilipes TaxID=299642 RepID=A0A8X6MX46_NEPPI|nr:retrovirus-related Pol polyprotein from transposon 297 [Nephila pilipes]